MLLLPWYAYMSGKVNEIAHFVLDLVFICMSLNLSNIYLFDVGFNLYSSFTFPPLVFPPSFYLSTPPFLFVQPALCSLFWSPSPHKIFVLAFSFLLRKKQLILRPSIFISRAKPSGLDSSHENLLTQQADTWHERCPEGTAFYYDGGGLIVQLCDPRRCAARVCRTSWCLFEQISLEKGQEKSSSCLSSISR